MRTVIKTYKFKLYKNKRTSIWMTASMWLPSSGTTALQCTVGTTVCMENTFLLTS